MRRLCRSFAGLANWPFDLLCAGEGPVATSEYIVEALRDFKRNTTNGRVGERLFIFPKAAVIADFPKRCDITAMPKGSLTRIFRTAALAIAAFTVANAAAAATPQRIIAVGDLHGDYGAWQDIARAAGLIDARGHWAGGKTI